MSYTETGIVEMELVRTFEEDEDVEKYLTNLIKELKLDMSIHDNVYDVINYDDSGYFYKNRKLFKILSKHKSEELESVTIKQGNKVLFICSYYNGGTSLEEIMIEECKV